MIRKMAGILSAITAAPKRVLPELRSAPIPFAAGFAAGELFGNAYRQNPGLPNQVFPLYGGVYVDVRDIVQFLGGVGMMAMGSRLPVVGKWALPLGAGVVGSVAYNIAQRALNILPKFSANPGIVPFDQLQPVSQAYYAGRYGSFSGNFMTG